MKVGASRKIFVTGAAGYVGTYIMPLLESRYEVLAIDKVTSDSQSVRQFDLAADEGLHEILLQFAGSKPIIVLHLAAARFDFGAAADAYYRDNVRATKSLLAALDGIPIQQIVHISSVAAIDGSRLTYQENLGTDDAYRVTKFLQEQLVQEYTEAGRIACQILAPSAIFNDELRADTNIGKLQKLTRWSRVMPKIPVRKSLTYLPSFCSFIVEAIDDKIQAGRYLTIERPILEVTETVHFLSGGNLRLVYVPGLYSVLLILSWILHVLSGLGRVDLKLTPNRIEKLFKDTSYAADYGYDSSTYNEYHPHPLNEILAALYKP